MLYRSRVLFTKLMHYKLCQKKLPNYSLRSMYVLSKITSKSTMYKISPLSSSPMSNHLVVRLSPLSDYLLSEYPLSEIHCQSYATTMVVKLYKISIIKNAPLLSLVINKYNYTSVSTVSYNDCRSIVAMYRSLLFLCFFL